MRFAGHDLGRAIYKAFDLRLRGDYKEQVVLTQEQVQPYLSYGRSFVDVVQKYLKERGLI